MKKVFPRSMPKTMENGHCSVPYSTFQITFELWNVFALDKFSNHLISFHFQCFCRNSPTIKELNPPGLLNEWRFFHTFILCIFWEVYSELLYHFSSLWNLRKSSLLHFPRRTYQPTNSESNFHGVPFLLDKWVAALFLLVDL